MFDNQSLGSSSTYCKKLMTYFDTLLILTCILRYHLRLNAWGALITSCHKHVLRIKHVLVLLMGNQHNMSFCAHCSVYNL